MFEIETYKKPTDWAQVCFVDRIGYRYRGGCS
jgi:hypothetical protein